MSDFPKLSNNATGFVGAAGYVAGSGTLALRAGGGERFPALAEGEWFAVTVIRAPMAYSPAATEADYTIFEVLGVDGDTLTLGDTLEGTTDRNYLAGSVVQIRTTAGLIEGIYTAIDDAGEDLDSLSSIAVKTTSTYANPSWLTQVAASKVAGSIPQSQIAGLLDALDGKASLSGAVFTGPITVTSAGNQTSGLQFANTASTVAGIPYLMKGFPGYYDGYIVCGRSDVGGIFYIDATGMMFLRNGAIVRFQGTNSGIGASSGVTRLIMPDSTGWLFEAASTITIRINGSDRITINSSGSTFNGPVSIPSLNDISVPNGGIANSLNAANTLRYRTLDGYLTTLEQRGDIIQPDPNVTEITVTNRTRFVPVYTLYNDITVYIPNIATFSDGHELIIKNYGVYGFNVKIELIGAEAGHESDQLEFGIPITLANLQSVALRAAKNVGQWVVVANKS